MGLKISILVLTYNHEQFIRECLNHIFSQQLDFKYEVLIHDDGSTDGTIEIIKEYQQCYKNIVLIIKNDKHLGKREGFKDILEKFSIDSEYVAICDGDDYWTDELKLTKQINFLDENKEYSFCCHRFKTLFGNEIGNEFAHSNYVNNQDLEIDFNTFYSTWPTQPSTTVFRGSLYAELILFAKDYKYFRDVHLFYFLLKHGKGISLNEFMAIYRLHEKGIASGKSLKERLIIRKNVFEELVRFNPKDKRLKKQYLIVVRRLILRSKLLDKLKLYHKSFIPSLISFKDFAKLNYYLIKR